MTKRLPPPFLPYGRQVVTEDDIEAVLRVLRGPFLTQGPAVPAFEKVVSTKVRANHGVACNSATSALHIACLSMGLSKGDILWTTPISFVASANCGLYCGADVDFVDIDKKTGLMCTKALKKKLEEAEKYGRLPKVVIPVHLCGTSCDMKRIAELGRRYNFKIIEDASHAIGGKYLNEPVGNCKYSEITIFSFHPVKIITTIEGGMAVTNDAKLAHKMKLLRSHGITKNFADFDYKSEGLWHYEQQTLGFNYRMSDVSAALGTSQMKRLDQIIEERQKIRREYKAILNNRNIKLLEIPKNTDSSLHLVVAILAHTDTEKHKRIFKNMRESNIGVQLHYSPIHLQPYFRKKGFNRGYMKNAEEYAQKAISLPIYPGLKISEIKRSANELIANINQ